MKLEIFGTVDGSIRVGGAEDEGDPLLTLEFSNEFRSIPEDIRFQMALAALDRLKSLRKSQP